MGVVFQAEHRALGRTVAIKFLSALDPGDEALERFRREAQVVQDLHNEHLVRVHDFGEAEGVPYFVMEHVAGESLASIRKQRKRIPPEQTVDWLLQLADGLAEAHAAGIVHRDVKLSNAILTHRPGGSPLVKLVDFGIASAAGTSDATLTSSGAVLGSPSYMSPEQVRSARSVDGRTDVWALGVMAYALLNGRMPFRGESPSGVCAAVVADDLPPHEPDVPRSLVAVIDRCLEKSWAKRMPDMPTLAESLAPHASDAGRAFAARTVAVYRPRTPALDEQPPPSSGTLESMTASATVDSEAAAPSAGPAEAASAEELASQTVAPHSTSLPPRASPRRWPWIAGAGGLAVAALAIGSRLLVSPVPPDAATQPPAASDAGPVEQPSARAETASTTSAATSNAASSALAPLIPDAAASAKPRPAATAQRKSAPRSRSPASSAKPQATQDRAVDQHGIPILPP